MSTEHEVEALFRAERAVQPAPSAIEHGWYRLAFGLAANLAPLPVAAGAAGAASAGKVGSLGLVSKWLLLGFGLSGAGLVASTQLSTPRPASEPTIALPTRAAVHAASGSHPIASARADAEHEVAAAAVAPSAAPAGREPRVTAKGDSAPAPPTFDAELALITRAKGELDAHRLRQARDLLAEHAQRFPTGVFAVERDALQILADCEGGPRNEALARAFATQHPSSPLIERLQRACRSRVDFSNSTNDSTGPGERMTKPSEGEQR